MQNIMKLTVIPEKHKHNRIMCIYSIIYFYSYKSESNNIEEAKAIQAYIFKRIKNKEFPDDVVNINI